MANRRMFNLQIVDSDAFLDMPISAQALYFHLGMRADDDGFLNNARMIKRMVGASDDDLRLLIAKKFLIVMEDGVIVIKHWKLNNYIPKDRYKPSVYHGVYMELQQKENGVYTLDTTCIQTVSNLDTQNSIDKNRVSIDKRESKVRTRTGYGPYKNVLLSECELDSLKAQYPDNWNQMIDYFSSYMKSSGKKYADHLATICKWAEEDAKKTTTAVAPALNYQQHTYTEADFGEDFYYNPDRDFK